MDEKAVETAGQPAKASNPLKWVVIIGCGCLALACIGFALFFGGIAGIAIAATQPAADAAKRHVDLVRGGQVDAAYQETSQAFKSGTDRQEFQAFVEQNQALYTATDLSFTNRNVQNQTATLEGTAKGPQGEVGIRILLVHENDAWRVQGVGPPQ